MNKKGLIFIALAIIVAVVGFFAMDTSGDVEAINGAVYVEDGKVLPENEGKVVIVAGKVTPVSPLFDELTGVELPGVIAKRSVERYERESVEDEEGYSYILDWNPTVLGEDNEFNEMVSCNLIADCMVGEFHLDENICHHIAHVTRYGGLDKSVAYDNGYNVFYKNGVEYLSRVDFMPDGGEDYNGYTSEGFYSKSYYMDYENMPRISYTVQDDSVEGYTFVGVQKNGVITFSKELSGFSVYDGILTIDEMIEKTESSAMTGAIVAWVIAAFLLFIGILKSKKQYVPTDEEVKEIEKEIE